MPLLKLIPRLRKVAVIVALVGCCTVTFLALRFARNLYAEVQQTRLDPLGLRAARFDSSIDRPLVVFYGDSRASEWPEPSWGVGRTLNRGIAAQTTEQVLWRFEQSFSQLSPRVIVIQVGINDLKTIPLFPDRASAIVSRSKENLSALVARARERCELVVVCTVIPTGEIELLRKPVWSEKVNAAVVSVNEHILSLTSSRVLVFNITNVVVGHDGKLIEEFQRDFLHLSPSGYAALNRSLGELLTPWMVEK